MLRFDNHVSWRPASATALLDVGNGGGVKHERNDPNAVAERMDAVGRIVRLAREPRRIVSLCPSQTELLFALGVGARVVGLTKFCVHPASEVASRTRVGGTKDVKTDRVCALAPDLVLAEKEENTRELVEELARRFPVFVTDVVDIPSALAMIRTVGSIVGRSVAGVELAERIEHSLRHINPPRPRRVLYLIWRRPWMAAGRGTFIDSVLTVAGFENAVEASRYPELSEETLRSLGAEYVLLSSEPFTFRRKHLDELTALMPSSRIEFVDGQVFSWYGSRMLTIEPYVKSLWAKLEPR